MTARDNPNLIYYGSPETLPEQHQLAAGPLEARFDSGELLNLRWRGREVLHRIYAAVRDRHWGTVALRLSDLRIDQRRDSFQVLFRAHHQQNEIDFAWTGSIEATAAGQLVFCLDGEALSTFLRSRIGFCLLHDVKGCAGRTFRATRPDGVSVSGIFPESIALEQPIKGTEAMVALEWESTPGLRVSIEFAGDIFQMEDQRNWTDATFKTFCTPLELPCPLEIHQGARVSQRVMLSVKEHQPVLPVSFSEGPVAITIGTGVPIPMPPIGLGIASHGEPLTPKEVEWLRALRLSHLRVNLKLREPDWQSVLQQAIIQTRQLGCELEAAVFVSNSAREELGELSNAVAQEQPDVCRWLIFHQSEIATSERWILLARKFLRSRIGSGTNSNFYELGAFHSPVGGLDFICFSIHPQEHTFDHASLMETLPIQAQVVQNARLIHGVFPVAISPVTLKPRFNPNATGPENATEPGELPAQVDARQMSLFGAVWTLGSLKYLCESGVDSVTYYETTGWRGVMEREAGSPLPEKFRSLPGAAFPVYHVFADIGEFAGGQVLPSRSTEPDRVVTMSISKGEKRRILAGNLTGEKLQVTLRDLTGRARVTTLDESSVLNAMTDPQAFRRSEPVIGGRSCEGLVIELRPYSIIRIDTAP